MEPIEVENTSFPREQSPVDAQRTASSSSELQPFKKQRERKFRRGRKSHHCVKRCNEKSGITLDTREKIKSQSKKRKKRSAEKVRGPLLRPVGSQVPQAPNNSTQFIMDNHEDSSLFVAFNQNSEDKVPEADGSSPFQPADWFPYNVADFNYAYRSAKEDKLMKASNVEIKKAIIAMETKVGVLANHLSASPSRLLSKLQQQLLFLQEENNLLNAEAIVFRRSQCACSSSSTTTTSSSSTSSSSDSSSDSDDSSGSSSSDSSEDYCSPRHQLEKPETEKVAAWNEASPDSRLS